MPTVLTDRGAPMARKGSRAKAGRDLSRIARTMRPGLPPQSDRRLWTPQIQPAPLRFSGVPVRRLKMARSVVAISRPRSAPLSVPNKVSFKPVENSICVRRGRRRAVLFATGKGGRRGRQKRHRRSFYSNVSCRR